MPQAYFDNLAPDYTQEIPVASEKSMETLRRLLFMFKLAINGHMMVLNDATNGGVVAISPEFESNFGWTLEEFKLIEPEDFFHVDSWEAVAKIHGVNELAGPYIAQCFKKNGNSDWFQVQGLTVEFDDHRWRMLSLVEI